MMPSGRDGVGEGNANEGNDGPLGEIALTLKVISRIIYKKLGGE